MTNRKEVNPKIREIGMPVIFVFIVIALIMIMGGLWYQGKGITDVSPDVIISDSAVVETAPVEEAPVEAEEASYMNEAQGFKLMNFDWSVTEVESSITYIKDSEMMSAEWTLGLGEVSEGACEGVDCHEYFLSYYPSELSLDEFGATLMEGVSYANEQIVLDDGTNAIVNKPEGICEMTNLFVAVDAGYLEAQHKCGSDLDALKMVIASYSAL